MHRQAAKSAVTHPIPGSWGPSDHDTDTAGAVPCSQSHTRKLRMRQPWPPLNQTTHSRSCSKRQGHHQQALGLHQQVHHQQRRGQRPEAHRQQRDLLPVAQLGHCGGSVAMRDARRRLTGSWCLSLATTGNHCRLSTTASAPGSPVEHTYRPKNQSPSSSPETKQGPDDWGSVGTQWGACVIAAPGTPPTARLTPAIR